MNGQESFCFSTILHHPAGCQQSCRTRLSVDRSIEATTPHGPDTWLGACVLGVARRCECSEVARTAYGACASDGRSAGAWTERAPILRGREGVKLIGVCGLIAGGGEPSDDRDRATVGTVRFIVYLPLCLCRVHTLYCMYVLSSTSASTVVPYSKVQRT